jgi:hypothetical protein
MYFDCHAFHNTNPRDAMMDGYAGEPVTASAAGLHEIEAANPHGAAEGMFALLNRDDRPGRYVERSLSVGDVVRVEYWAPEEKGNIYGYVQLWYAVEAMGFRPIERPRIQPLRV